MNPRKPQKFNTSKIWCYMVAKVDQLAISLRYIVNGVANLGRVAVKQLLLPCVARRFFSAPLPQRARSALLASRAHT